MSYNSLALLTWPCACPPPRASPPLPQAAQHTHDTGKTRSRTQCQIQHRAYSSVLTKSWIKNIAIKIVLRPLPTPWALILILEPWCPSMTNPLCQAGCGTGLLKSNFSSSEHFGVSRADSHTWPHQGCCVGVIHSKQSPSVNLCWLTFSFVFL